jgi:phage repressor protein C with HTH and peptisase S24 domain
VLKKQAPKRQHYKNDPFLKALGSHCENLRTQKGYSMDRLSKESEQLSTSAISRLEKGSGAVDVLVLFRYAEAMGHATKDLFEFFFSAENRPSFAFEHIDLQSPRIKKEAFVSLLPVYSLKAAAGCFGAGEDVEPEGWIDVGQGRKLDKKMFVARAKGNSMLPGIRDGDFLVFRAHPSGTKQGKIVLVQYRGPADSDTGGSYTVKKYHSSKVISGDELTENRQVILSPTNPDYEPIVLTPKDESEFSVIAEYLFSL